MSDSENRPAKDTRFKPGQSGNPGGRSKVEREVQNILDAAGPEAGKRLLELMRCGDPKIALAAVRDLLDRVIGKPKESVSVETSSTMATLLAAAMGVKGINGTAAPLLPSGRHNQPGEAPSD